MSVMWMPAETMRAPLAERFSASIISGPTGAKTMAASSCSGGRLVGAAGPVGAEAAGEGLALLVAGLGEGEDAPALVFRHLADDVRRGAEAVEAEALGVAGQAQRAVADQPGAEQRRRLQVGEALGYREAEALVGDGVLGVAAVDVVAGEAARCRRGSRDLLRQ